MKALEIISVTLLLAGCANGQNPGCDATATWERMIEAKGGRPALDAVGTLFRAGAYEWRQFLVRHRIDERTLYRFPDFKWSWYDSGTDQLGVEASKIYVDRGYGFSILGPGSRPAIRRRTIIDKFEPFAEAVVLLMETRWLKPLTISCAVQGWTTTVDVQFPGASDTLRYYLQRDATLPNRVDFLRAGSMIERCHLEGYQRFGGLLLPTKLRRDSSRAPGPTLTFKYEVNPNYDPQITEGMPSLDAGPDAWRRR